MTITRVKSAVTAFGIGLGTIDQEVTFAAAGKKTTASPDLNLAMNLNPPDIFTLLRDLALTSGMETAQIDGIVQLGGYSYTGPSPVGMQNRKRSDLKKRNIYS